MELDTKSISILNKPRKTVTSPRLLTINHERQKPLFCPKTLARQALEPQVFRPESLRTSLKGDRLINMILLMTLAYSSGIFQGTEIRKKQVQKYVSRRKEPKKRYRRRSTFGVGLDGEKWVNYLEQYSDEVEQ
jgi:hypothetical protein